MCIARLIALAGATLAWRRRFGPGLLRPAGRQALLRGLLERGAAGPDGGATLSGRLGRDHRRASAVGSYGRAYLALK